jgi:hypothetical protein
VATALIIAWTLLTLHTSYWPYKRRVLNRLQLLCLSVLSIIYLTGVLLKTESILPGEIDRLGWLLVALLVIAMLAVAAMMISEVNEGERHSLTSLMYLHSPQSAAPSLMYLHSPQSAAPSLMYLPSACQSQVHAVHQWANEMKYAVAAMEVDPGFDPGLSDHVIRVDELELGAVLGQGAEGVVRRAVYAGADVAVKIECVSMASCVPLAELLQHAQSEAQMLQPLRHPVSGFSNAHSSRFVLAASGILKALPTCKCRCCCTQYTTIDLCCCCTLQ